MKGHIVERGTDRYALVFYVDAGVDAAGRPMRKQKWHTFHGKKKAAQNKLTELLAAYDKGDYVEPKNLTVGEWLDTWLESAIKPSKRPSTYAMYELVVRKHLKPAIGAIPLQKLEATHVERYHAARLETHEGATLSLHHAVLVGALKSAVKKKMASKNVATLVDWRPKAKSSSDAAKEQAWTADEARRVLVAAKAAGPQWAALFTLALDSGMRKGELCGLRWSDVDLDGGTVAVCQQLATPRKRKRDADPVFGPTKNGRSRRVDISESTVTALREHKRAQSEVKMKNRQHYRDHGLVFAKDWSEVRTREDALGLPLDADHLGSGPLAKLIKAADVKPITFHGLRHTCATLLLGAGEPAHVVAERLGHANATVTLSVYAHVLPSMGRRAATTIGAILAG